MSTTTAYVPPYLLIAETNFDRPFLTLHDTVSDAEQEVRKYTGSPEMDFGEVLRETEVRVRLYAFTEDEAGRLSGVELWFTDPPQAVYASEEASQPPSAA